MKAIAALVAAVCGLALSTFAIDAAQAERRVALVIGNSEYQNVARLDNPDNDASAVADLFRKAGFDVVSARNDLGVVEFKRSIREFVNTTRNADIAVVYYAGHGFEVNGINYLIPVDAKLASDLDAEDEAVDLDRIVRALEPARRFRLVILDACRDNPFARKMQRTIATRAVTNGLAKVEPMGTDTLIAYAAKAGSTAEDGSSGHSPFTAALLNNLAEPGLDVRIAFGRVRDEVLKKTGSRQEPFVYGSLGGSTISLVPPPPEPPKATISAVDLRTDYEMAERVGTVAAWDSFLAAHPTGFYADLARAQRAKLGGPAQAQPPGRDMTIAALPPPAKPPEQQERATPDRLAWDKLQDSEDPNALRAFIKRFRTSPLATTAQHRLELIEQAAAQRRQQELERQKADREAARQRDEEARRMAALEAERQKAEREAERFRQEEERRAKQAALPPEAPPAREPQANAREQVLAAQKELRRIGCYEGRETGSLDSRTRQAIGDYYAKRGVSSAEIQVTDTLVSELKQQAALESCIAKREEPKPTPVVREKQKPAPVAEPRREKKPETATRREARPARQEPPKARTEAAARRPAGGGGGGGGHMMTGVGF